MKETLLGICNRTISWSFYLIFFLVPLALMPDTSELFELNKMWLTWALTVIIAAAWFSKMILSKSFRIQRTPLDIPIALFFLSQLIATFHSLDSHISFWGYYSRFNGGLLSFISYIFLYYAFASNYVQEKGIKMSKRLISVSLLSGLCVALWGLPSHFGSDPTCLLFRGSFDVSCWTADFHPTVRIFSTMGQPDWLAAYLCVLLPISIALFLGSLKTETDPKKKFQISNFKFQISKKSLLFSILYLLITILFYLDLIYSGAKSGFLGFAASIAVLIVGSVFLKRKFSIGLLVILVCIGSITFFFGSPISQLQRFTFQNLTASLSPPPPSSVKKTAAPTPAPAPGELGGTDSGKIRLYVWQGAIDVWRANPIFGTGVETFAFAYYAHRPVGHNETSEWNFLYNKAHNEYLNYLATTGALGLGTYLLFIAWFLFVTIKNFLANYTLDPRRYTLILGLLSGYISILVTNFFGFSVVMINVYFFFLPLFALMLLQTFPEKTLGFGGEKETSLHPQKNYMPYAIRYTPITGLQWTAISIVILIALYELFLLFRFWTADKLYGLGNNLNHAGQYVTADKPLHDAIDIRDDEPVFKDELANNEMVLAVASANQKDTATAQKLATEAIALNNQITTDYPNNLIFWKSRVRLFHTLSAFNPQYNAIAIEAIEKAAALAPTDATISYNRGVLYGQAGQLQKAVDILQQTVKLKPDYRDAYYALSLFYQQMAVDTKDPAQKKMFNQKAIYALNYILKNIFPNDADTKKLLNSIEK